MLVLLFFGSAILFGWARTQIFLQYEAARDLSPYVGKEREVEGKVINDPERRETSLHIYVYVSEIDGGRARGTILATLPREAQINFGDQVKVVGKLELPEVFETNTGRLFDYPGYLRVRGATALMYYASLEDRVPGGWSLRGTLFALKHTFENSLRRLLPEPDVSLMEGILLGERRGVPEDLNYALIVVGLIHIVVLSGYNISVVAEQVLRLFNLFLSRRVALMVGAVAVVAFAITVGAGATVVRATVMGLIAILARVLGRPAAALRALALAAGAMALWNPLVVLYDPSFILSVLATFGLITLSPMVEKRIRFVPERFGLRSIVASTIAVQIYILPALLYMTGILSFFALVANALVLPLVPAVMLIGFLAGIVGLVHTALALPLAVVTHLLLVWFIGVATVVAGLPFSSATVVAFPAWVAVLVYVPLTLFAIWQYQKSLRKMKSEGVA
ncbi:MAG: ComEC/Rec2 family competence protein [Candidatus Adlerbacteria bacterium]|nr:ComEC/Rec2 family competence protein [Candidatus Adlerbacteria bacterium]